MFIASGSATQTCKLLTEHAQCIPCKRQKQHGGSGAALQPAQARSLSPYLRRVGGGYDYIYPQVEFPSKMPARIHSYSPGTRRARSPAGGAALLGRPRTAAALLEGCHHDYDMRILAEIIQQAEADAADSGKDQVNALPAS